MMARHRKGPNGILAAMSPSRAGSRGGRPRGPREPRRLPDRRRDAAPHDPAAPPRAPRSAVDEEHDDGAERGLERACEERERGARPAEPCARQHDELGVAEAHARPPAERPVPDDERQPDSDQTHPRSEKRVAPAETAKARRREAEEGAADRDRIGQEHVRQVDERCGDERQGEGEVRQEDRGCVHERRVPRERPDRRPGRSPSATRPPRTSTAT